MCPKTSSYRGDEHETRSRGLWGLNLNEGWTTKREKSEIDLRGRAAKSGKNRPVGQAYRDRSRRRNAVRIAPLVAIDWRLGESKHSVLVHLVSWLRLSCVSRSVHCLRSALGGAQRLAVIRASGPASEDLWNERKAVVASEEVPERGLHYDSFSLAFCAQRVRVLMNQFRSRARQSSSRT